MDLLLRMAFEHFGYADEDVFRLQDRYRFVIIEIDHRFLEFLLQFGSYRIGDRWFRFGFRFGAEYRAYVDVVRLGDTAYQLNGIRRGVHRLLRDRIHHGYYNRFLYRFLYRLFRRFFLLCRLAQTPRIAWRVDAVDGALELPRKAVVVHG